MTQGKLSNSKAGLVGIEAAIVGRERERERERERIKVLSSF
jgi:hypothetical protein